MKLRVTIDQRIPRRPADQSGPPKVALLPFGRRFAAFWVSFTFNVALECEMIGTLYIFCYISDFTRWPVWVPIGRIFVFFLLAWLADHAEDLHFFLMLILLNASFCRFFVLTISLTVIHLWSSSSVSHSISHTTIGLCLSAGWAWLRLSFLHRTKWLLL